LDTPPLILQPGHRVAGSAPCATAAPSAAALSAAAAAAGVVLVGGSVPERDAAGKLYNSCLVFDAAGRVLAKHRKARRGCQRAPALLTGLRVPPGPPV
jgi:predicted amidohydrolase